MAKGKRTIRRSRFVPIKVRSKNELAKYTPTQANRELNNFLKELKKEIDNEMREFVNQDFDWIHESSRKKVDNILQKDFTSARALKNELKRALKKTVYNRLKQSAENDAFKALNKAELLASKASAIRQLKYWVSRFDAIVRPWHDAVNHQHKPVGDKFVVPYPGGVDYLDGPKIPPISSANFMNCRCFMEFEVVKK